MNRLKIFLAVAVLLILPSCEETTEPDAPAVYFPTIEKNTGEEVYIPQEPETAFYTQEESEPAEKVVKNRELYYDAPYTVEEIKEIFGAGKEAFENIKDLAMPDGYDYFIAKKTKIEFYNSSGAQNRVSYDIDETSGYKILYDFFNKYEHIFFIHSINPNAKNYSEQTFTAMFKLLMVLPGLDAGYVPWAEIRYNKTGGEIKEASTGEYIVVPLDSHWYYIYSNVWFD